MPVEGSKQQLALNNIDQNDFFFNLAVKQDAESSHFPDYLKQLGQCGMVVLL